jgi:hypothetical protein
VEIDYEKIDLMGITPPPLFKQVKEVPEKKEQNNIEKLLEEATIIGRHVSC